MAVVGSIDQTDLDSLARTCRGIRAGLLQHLAILPSRTLRCAHDQAAREPEATPLFRTRSSNWPYMVDDTRRHHGKAYRCARDMVAPCRRCDSVVCRVSNPPPSRGETPLWRKEEEK